MRPRGNKRLICFYLGFPLFETERAGTMRCRAHGKRLEAHEGICPYVDTQFLGYVVFAYNFGVFVRIKSKPFCVKSKIEIENFSFCIFLILT